MNKAKAIFTVAIVAVVAGASAVLWHLNDSGSFGTPGGDDDNILTTVATTVGSDNNDKDDKNEILTSNDGNSDSVDENDGQDSANTDSVSTKSINDFLSEFSKVYFSENKAYSSDKADAYELIRFAYTYTMNNNQSRVTTEYIDDDIGYYNKISEKDVNDVIGRFFDKTVKSESVYTEKTYGFFKYDDGYFYTPAADGVDYRNVCITDTFSQNRNVITVEFSVYSSGVTTDMTSQQARRASNDRYASGAAKISVENGEYTLKSYKITK